MKKSVDHTLIRVTCITGVALVLTCLSACYSCASRMENHIQPMNINAAVTGFKDRTTCFGDIVLSDNHILSVCDCVPDKAIIDSINVGDSIIKPGGAIDITIVKKVSKQRITILYPCCDQ